MRWAVLALCAALACCAAAQTEEGPDAPVFTTQTYAIVHNGEVVGMMHHVHAEAVFGRRGGPSDDRPPSPLALRLADLWSSQADALATMRDRLLATRCPLARQVALARLQLAAAAAGASQPRDEFEPGFSGMAEPAVMDLAWEGEEEAEEAGQAAEDRPLLGRDGHGVLVHRLPARDGRQHKDARQNVFGLTPDASQAPRDHPEDLVDFATAQQELLGAEEEEAGVAEAEPEATVGTAGAGFLMPRRPAADPHDAWDAAGADEELPAMPLLMPRLAVDEVAREAAPLLRRQHGGASTQPFAGQAGPAPVAEEAPGAPSLLALVWTRLADLAQPRPLPDIRGGGAPHPRPLDPRPAVHHNGHMPHMPHMPHMMPQLLPRSWPLMTESGELLTQAPDGRWVNLRDIAAPVPASQAEVSWHLHNDDGTLNWGLITFVFLATACAGVWGALVAQYALYRSTFANRRAATAAFVARVDSEKAAALQPLLHEGPAKPAVECAADHIAEGGSVPAYVLRAFKPLSSSDK